MLAAITPGFLVGGGVTVPSYAEYLAAVDALSAGGTNSWAGTANTGTRKVNAAAATGIMSGSSWVSAYGYPASVPCRIIQHGLPSQAVFNEQVAAGRSFLMVSSFLDTATTVALDRNGYPSVSDVGEDRYICTFLAYYDATLGPMKMNPRLGLGPIPWDMVSAVY